MVEEVSVSGKWSLTWQNPDGNIIAREEKNLITQSGLNALAAIFCGEIPADNAIFIALGTGTAAAVSGDTKLGDEGYRKIITSKGRNLNELRIRFFIPTTEAIGNWSELGVFLAATSVSGSGQLLNRVLPSGGISKAANQTLTIEVRIPLVAA